jgi:hypothetical protein
LGLLSLFSRQPEVTDQLLQLAGSHDVVGLCAHDAHGIPRWPWSSISSGYEDIFRTFAVYLPRPQGGALSADAAQAASQVRSALARGEAWCGFRSIAPAGGFSLHSAGGAPGRTARSGETLEVRLPAAIPPQTQVRVFGPGTLLEDGRSVRLEAPGAVQIEVWARVPGLLFADEDGWKPWIVPSPVRVVPPAAEAPVAVP